MTNAVTLSQENSTDFTYLVTHPQLTGNINTVLLLLTTPSLNMLKIVITTYEPNMSFGKEDISINRFSPVTIDKPAMKNDNSQLSTCYHVHCSKFFSLSVVLVESSVSMASYTAIPVDLWHTEYYIVAPWFSPVVQIVSHTMATITFVPRFQNVDYKFTFQNQSIYSGDDILIRLQGNQAFSLQFCNNSGYRSISGSFIKASQTVGVIISNCRLHKASTDQCPVTNMSHDLERSTHDITSEMILGDFFYGVVFITLPIVNTNLNGEYMIVAQHVSTNVVISQVTKSAGHVKLNHKGDWTTIGISRQPARIASDKPIQVLLVLQTSCQNRTNERWTDLSSTGLIVPSNLFFTRYFWLNWDYKDLNLAFHLMLIVRYNHAQYIFLDNRRIDQNRFHWSSVDGEDSWKVGAITVSGTAHDVFEINHSSFGCYLYVEGDNTISMNYVGLTTQNCELSLMSDETNDGIDNDCDNMTDEEEENGIDDDNDLMIDEDLNDKSTDVINVVPKHAKNNCRHGLFGEGCKFMCRCDDRACDGDGDCLTATRCSPGWFASMCQYRE
ncbi:hypothetical protein Btru_056244 [Bulinus truncatus]|nr:hypothetical protein Btru_056244 [Bulinus truncatus]